MNSLKGHIDAALRGSETTGVNVNPWRIEDGYTTPNIHQPWTPPLRPILRLGSGKGL